ncbi:MAG: hypothetical protein R3C45_16865 [Phycisphaerales bacterium]
MLGNWNQNVAAGDPLVGDPSGDRFVRSRPEHGAGQLEPGILPVESVVPEPATLSLLTIAGLILAAAEVTGYIIFGVGWACTEAGQPNEATRLGYPKLTSVSYADNVE